MTELEMIIAECPQCGARRYSWDEEDAVYKLSKHICPKELSDEELVKAIEDYLEGLKDAT